MLLQGQKKTNYKMEELILLISAVGLALVFGGFVIGIILLLEPSRKSRGRQSEPTTRKFSQPSKQA